MMKKRILSLVLVLATLFTCCVLVSAAVAETDGVATVAAQLATPKITSVSGGAGSVKISWGAVAGAAKYRVFYKNGSSWKKIADTTSTSYTWTGAKAGTKYTFTVRCVSSDGSAFTSNYNTTGTSYTVPLATPQITSVTSSGTSVTVTWGKVAGAEKYRLFYKKDGKWTKLRDTTGTSATITGGTPGKTYTYTVRCINSAATAYTSSYDATGKSITLTLATPKISSVSGSAGSVKISWGKVSGAAKYRVFYKNGSSWKKIADTTSTSYTWTGAQAGTKYTFTVRCVSADGNTFTSNYNTTGTSYTVPMAAPKLSSVVGTSNGVTVSWGKVSGAAKYRVFYKTGSSGWKKIADTTSTSYTWKGASTGTKYTFTVRCVSADGNSFTSDYDTAGKSITYVAAPKLTSLTKVPTGIKVSWNAVSGAAKYRVFFKTNNSGWVEAGDTTATSYILTGAVDGIKYTFTVRCVSADGSTYTSGYDATGLSLTYKVDTPKNFKASYYAGDIRLTWNSVSNADYYLVVYRVGGYDLNATNWQSIDWTYSTYMDVSGGTAGVTYTFVVVAVDMYGNMSDYAHYTYTHR